MSLSSHSISKCFSNLPGRVPLTREFFPRLSRAGFLTFSCLSMLKCHLQTEMWPFQNSHLPSMITLHPFTLTHCTYQNTHSTLSSQRPAKSFYKGLESKYRRLCLSNSLCHNYLALLLWCQSSHRQYVNRRMCLSFNKTLFIKTAEGQIWPVGSSLLILAVQVRFLHIFGFRYYIFCHW